MRLGIAIPTAVVWEFLYSMRLKEEGCEILYVWSGGQVGVPPELGSRNQIIYSDTLEDG